MNELDFMKFYDSVVKELGMQFEREYEQFHFCDNPNSLYEEYLNQKTMLRILYEKKDGVNKTLLDRHKVCACMTVAIVKVRLLSGNIKNEFVLYYFDGITVSIASLIEEILKNKDKTKEIVECINNIKEGNELKSYKTGSVSGVKARIKLFMEGVNSIIDDRWI